MAERDIRELRAEIKDLREKLDELIAHSNREGHYHAAFRSAFDTYVEHRWYRFMMWWRPFPVPKYVRTILTPSVARDRTPVMRGAPDASPQYVQGDRPPAGE